MNFSVLMSVYNNEDSVYFEQSLKSIMHQTLKPTEVVLVKDGPLNPSLNQIIEQFKTKINLVIVSLKKNHGLSYALNIGLQHCNYDFVARFDTDDILIKNRFEKQINYIKQHPSVDILGGYAITIDDNNVRKSILKVPISHKEIRKKIWICPFIHPTVMFRRDFILEVGGYNPDSGHRQDDYDLWFRCYEKNANFANLDVPLIYYRFTNDNIKRNDLKTGLARFKVGSKYIKRLKLSKIAYIGLLIPIIVGVLPSPINIYFYKTTRIFKKVLNIL